jgi:uncharacterized protein YodC (DUF2158 family)
MPFAPGDVVTLKSGGYSMTVVAVSDKDEVGGDVAIVLGAACYGSARSNSSCFCARLRPEMHVKLYRRTGV